MSARPADQAVSELLHHAVSPAKVEIALRALEELDRDRAPAEKQWQLQIQQAEHEVLLAKKRYEAADPENRMVAGELEAESIPPVDLLPESEDSAFVDSRLAAISKKASTSLMS